MQKTFLGSALYWGLFVLTVTLIARWLSRSRLHPRSDGNDHGALTIPVGYLIIGVVGFAFFVALSTLSFVGLLHGKTSPIWVNAIFLGFAALSGCLIVQYLRVR